MPGRAAIMYRTQRLYDEARNSDSAGFRGYPHLPVEGLIDWIRPAKAVVQRVRANGPELLRVYTHASIRGGVDSIAALEARSLPEPFLHLAEPGHLLETPRRAESRSWPAERACWSLTAAATARGGCMRRAGSGGSSGSARAAGRGHGLNDGARGGLNCLTKP